jgi:site-specific DNA-methyltransferase (adenine-specific)
MELPINKIICMDCLGFMKDLPDKCIDLVLTDPPYGIHDKINNGGRTQQYAGNKFAILYDKNPWDRQRPPAMHFENIFRLSKNQIICGGNYFVEHLPVSRGWIFWDKMGEGMSSVNNELIFTSFDISIKTFQRCHGNDKGFMTPDGGLHPTQKPVALGLWILENYSKPDDLILDCYCGSGSFCVAAKMLNRRYIGIDISEEYCKIARERLEAVDTGVPVKEQRKGQLPLFLK